MGEGLEVRVWDEDVSVGRLAGSNRQYIEEVIPHIGSVLSGDLASVLSTAEVVILGNKSASKDQLAKYLRPEQIVIDLIHLDETLRPGGVRTYEGICW
jgi:GDP-mannose 6-dehydrogenase